MPSSSILSEFTFTNLGPLTTTWTAPASCATVTDDVKIGYSSYIGEAIWDLSCQVKENSCVPTGTSEDPALVTGLSPTYFYQGAYFSPGLYCPSGWTTAGVASRNGTQAVTSSGDPFSVTSAVPTSFDVPLMNNPANILMQLLEPNETAVVCCPSSMTAGPFIGCYSTLPDYKISTVCIDYVPSGDLQAVNQTFWYYGQTVVGKLYSLTGSVSLTDTQVVTFPPSQTSTLVAYSVLPFATFIHKPADYPATATAAATSNAAVRMSSMKGSWDVMGILVVSILGMALGAAIVLPV